jgi:hypothetical protein
MENEDKVVASTNATEDTDDTSADTFSDDNEQDVETLKAELEKERNARQQLTARAKKAEEQLKALKPRVEQEAPKHDYPDVDERILRANGMPDDLLKELKVIAEARKVSLIDAQNDSLFKLVKENYEKELKVKEASVGVSRGSGNAQSKKTPSTPGLSREEHKKFFQNLSN